MSYGVTVKADIDFPFPLVVGVLENLHVASALPGNRSRGINRKCDTCRDVMLERR